MKSGIYKITNVVNNKCYIGSAVNFNRRWYLHKTELRKNKHHSKHLQHAWNKYGEESFKFEVLFYCEKEELIKYEQLHFDELKPEYNICKVAGSMLGVKRGPLTDSHKLKLSVINKGKNPSEETVEKMRNSHKGTILSEERKEKIRESNLGLKRSSETRLKIKEANTGKKHSEETKAKMSNSQRMGLTDVRREKMSKCKIGELNHNFGKTLSKEEIERRQFTRNRNFEIKKILLTQGCAL